MSSVNLPMFAALTSVLLLTACSGGSEMNDYQQMQAEYDEHLESRNEPSEAQLQAEAEAAAEEYAEESARWTCYYDPTMNENWHDDVVCSNGYESERPILLRNDSFVEYEEIMQAAAIREARLNR